MYEGLEGRKDGGKGHAQFIHTFSFLKKLIYFKWRLITILWWFLPYTGTNQPRYPHLFFFFFNFWLRRAFVAVRELSLVAESRGYSLVAACGLILAVASPAAAHRLCSMQAPVAAARLSGWGTASQLGVSLVSQTVKSVCLQCRKPGFLPWVGKIPWGRKWQPTPELLPGKSHGQRINLPGPGIESASPAMAGRFPRTVPRGKSSSDLLKCIFLYITSILYSEMYDYTFCFFCLTCHKLLLKIIFKVKYTFNILLSDRLFFVSQRCKE